MMLEVYISLQIIAFLVLIIGFLPFSQGKQWLPPLLSFLLFIFLAFTSSEISTENCDYVISNTTINLAENVTSFSYINSCTTTNHRDIGLMYMNIGLCFLSAIYVVGVWFMREGQI